MTNPGNVCWLAAALLAVVVCSPTVARQSGTTPSADVRSAVEKWINGLEGKVYEATIRRSDGTSPLPATQINDRLFAFQEGDVYIGIGFSKTPTKNSSLEDLRAAFQHVALDRIPVPGIRAKNWATQLQTPTSSFKDGVTLESWKDGVLRLRVKTSFFAASGRRMDVRVPADAPMPQDTYFQIRKSISADLLIEGQLLPAGN